ncbi:hypothetical protein QTN25_009057 [Entamoeba marina]
MSSLKHQHKNLDSYSMMIVSKYLKFRNDFINMISVNSKFKETLDKFRFNPISITSNKLFQRIDTQFLYSPKDIVLEGIKHYQVCYLVNYDTTQQYPDNYTFKHILYDNATFQKYGDTALPKCNEMSKYYLNPLNEIVIPTQVTSLQFELNYQTNAVNKLILHNNIIRIEPECFKYFTNISTITLPTMLKELKRELFYGCKSLQSIHIPESIETIESGCFKSCSSLSSITFDCEICSIPSYCFNLCSSLKTISIPTSVTSIGDAAFCDCHRLVSLTIGSLISSFPKSCFMRCDKLNQIIVKDGENKELKEALIIPSFITSLGEGCFSSCSSLKSVIIPSSINTLSSECFRYCTSLSRIILSTTLTKLGDLCFDSTTKLHSINLPTTLNHIGKNVFGSITSISIPSSVNTISDTAFSNCKQLKEISFEKEPESLLILNTCTRLSSVTVQNTTKITSVVPLFISRLLSENNIECTSFSLQQFDLEHISTKHPESVGIIGDVVKSRNTIHKFDMDNSIKMLHNSCFHSCVCLTTINFSSTLRSIGSSCFRNCLFLNNVHLPHGIQSIPTSCFENCPRLQQIDIPTTVTSIEDMAFLNCNRIKQIIIPYVVKFGMKCFESCVGLTKIVINNKIDKGNIFPVCISDKCFEYAD